MQPSIKTWKEDRLAGTLVQMQEYPEEEDE